MGWLWSDTASPSSQLPPKTPESHAQPTSQPPIAPSTSNDEAPTTFSHDELADKELQSFLKELEADVKPSRSKYKRAQRQPLNSSPSSSSQRTSDDDNGDEPLSEQILPKTMSCRTAFDEAFYCNSFGGRFNDIYRYGTVRSCSEHWNKFWFCMRTRGFPENEKEVAVKEYYKKTEWTKYAKSLGRESSEDVWKSREKKVEWGEAFNTPFPPLNVNDEEWNRQQAEWRMAKAKTSGNEG